VKAIQFHDEEAAGNVDSIWKANRIFAQLRLDHPGCSITKAYHGNVAVLMARDASNPIEKRELARRGLRLLDEAVASSPQDTVVNMLRNSAASLLPDRSLYPVETAIEDYIHLIEWNYVNQAVLIKTLIIE
jgi:hypothetical protein